MTNLLFKEEAYEIIGLCMEVHKYLGPGFSEIVYKDALEIELKNSGFSYNREREYEVNYKGVILPHKFVPDFVVEDMIILEIKGIKAIRDEYIAQIINYLKVSGLKVGLLINFGEERLNFKRFIV
ncbi:MAG: GxxExxY protein [Bacteroidales bacterium]